jgi:prepilin-type N-terminal cleavage/methylation domain-containing protein
MIGTNNQPAPASQKRHGQRLGFTLIEVLVSVSLFTIIILGASQIFKMVINSQRSAIATQNVQESLRYFLEVIGKEIRMAQRNSDGLCAGIPPTEIFVVTTDSFGNNVLNFKNYYNQCVTYYLSLDPVATTTERFKISRNNAGVVQSDFISPLQINLDSLHFVLTESSSTQPTITINLRAHAVNEAQYKSTMTIQTSLASRYYR